MDKFSYKAKDKDGKSVVGVVEARNGKEAARVLREKGLLVISLSPKGKNLISEFKEGFFTKVDDTDRINFTRQLSTMITAGLPITEALSILEIQARPGMGRVVSEILREVESGGSLSESLGKHPETFGQTYVALIRAGESAGVLDKILSRLADNLEKQREFKSKIKSAMIYPAIVISGMLVVGGIMIIFVIPKLTSIYTEFQADLPLSTKILVSVSKILSSYWWICLIAVLFLFSAFKILYQRPKFRDYFDRLLFKLPIIGNLRRQIVLTEFTRTMGLLAGTGILIVDAMNIVSRSVGSSVYERAVKNASQEVEKGISLAVALARTEVFPPILYQMIAVGEETGNIDEVLSKVSAYFEQEVDVSVKSLTAALEPLIMVVLGVGVGFLIIAIIMPIYSLTSKF